MFSLFVISAVFWLQWRFRRNVPYGILNMTITSTLPQIAQKCSCSTLVVALILRYVRPRSITLGPPAHERTAPRSSFMTPWASATPCLAYLAVFTWVLAPAICSRLYTRLTHVIDTSHATQQHAHVLSCHARLAQHVVTSRTRRFHILPWLT